MRRFNGEFGLFSLQAFQQQVQELVVLETVVLQTLGEHHLKCAADLGKRIEA